MATTWDNLEKATTFSGGWDFNEVNLAFNQVNDPDTGNLVYFNGIGLLTTWTNIPKS